MKLRKAGHVELERYYPLMEIDFDKRELMSKAAIHKGLVTGNMELLMLSDDNGIDAAYALVLLKNTYGYVLLKYMGVVPWMRGKGVGIETMRAINRRYADKQGIIAELTAFGDEDGSYLKKLRRFFARFGYVDLPSDYRLGGARVCLMIKPIKGPWNLAPVSHRIILDFYNRCLSPAAVDRMIDIRPVN